MHRRLMRQLDGVPFLRSILRSDEEKNRAAVDRIIGIPCCAYCDLRLPIAIDVARGNANVVLPGEVLGEDKLFPARIPVPHKLLLIRQQNVELPIAIDVRGGNSVANLDFGINLNGTEPRCLKFSRRAIREATNLEGEQK